jgi:hypothetical protein
MSRAVSVGAALLLLAASAGSVSAAKQSKSFDATFCFTQSSVPEDPAGTGELTASVSWSGYRVTGIGFGVGDGTGAGFGVVQPVEPAARTGAETISLGVDNSVPFGGVDIRNGNHVWATIDQNAPDGNWANLPACA